MTINFNNISFKGIYATAYKKNGDEVKIQLPGDNAQLTTATNEFPRLDASGINASFAIKTSNDESEPSPFENGAGFTRLEIDSITANSVVKLNKYGETKIDTMQDQARLEIRRSFANIRRVSGDKVKIKVDDNRGFRVNETSQVNIETGHFTQLTDEECSLVAKGTNFIYHG